MRRPLLWSVLVITVAGGIALAGLRHSWTAPMPAAIATSAAVPPGGAPPAGVAATTPSPGPAVVAGIQPELLARYRAEAEAGDASAQDNLAVCYEQGLGLPADPLQAVRWYRASAAQGFAPAQFHLGECFEHGRGVERDLTQAADLYRRAAGNGISQARTALDRLDSPHG
jgi:hypothetical protein